MANGTIYLKSGTDQQLVVQPRCSFTRAFNVGTWTTLLMGFYIQATTASNINADVTTLENLTVNSPKDAFYVGLRNSASTAFPLTTGCQFIGAIPQNYQTAGAESAQISYGAPNNSIGTASSHILAVGLNDASVVGGGTYPTYQISAANQVAPAATTASNYNGLFMMKFVVVNAGLASQSVSVSSLLTTVNAPYTTDALRASLLGAGYGASVSIAWNSGGVALPIPDAMYMYWPFYNSRMRYSAVELVKVN